jgi:hypothetical protein
LRNKIDPIPLKLSIFTVMLVIPDPDTKCQIQLRFFIK